MPGGPQSGGVPTFTPTFSPNGAATAQNGAASQAAAPNGNGRGRRSDQRPQSSSGAYPESSSYQQAPRNGPGELDQPYQPYQPVPGYPNGAGYAGTGSYPAANGQGYQPAAQPDWRDGYPAAAQRPAPGGPGQGYPDEYPDQPADQQSSPGYAPPDQFGPPQQGYWQ
jgi:hypothetical protein